MKTIRSLAALILIGTACAYSQIPSNPVAFRASLLRFQKQSVEWRKMLDGVKVEELEVSYVEGKQIEKDKDTAVQNLSIATMLANRILNGGHLSDEVNLLTTVLDFGHQLESLETDLLEDATTHDSMAKATSWTDTLEKASGGPVNTLYLEIYQYVMSRSDEIEKKNCSSGQLAK